MGRGGGGGGQSKKEEEEELRGAKRAFKEAQAEGCREEEARWANVIGDIHKRRGEYVEALRWLRIDYEVSVKHLPQRHLLPSCQSLGEVYLRLGRFSEALTYQKKHLQLAKESDDLVEQQRASTQLGRTYHEMLLRSENDHSAIRNAKKYFKSSMKLARILKEKSPSQKSDFLKELIDAYNNMGMLELELDNFEQAEKLLIQGLKICDDEEVDSYDDARTRLHHNLGNVYTELRKWKKAEGHIEKDIAICKKIRHPQGEAKGFINLGEVNSRVQKYEDAKLCYKKALTIASCLEDEDALMEQINQNIETVTKAAEVLAELKKDELKLKKLVRDTSNARGTSKERKLLLEQYAWLDNLIDKARMICAWEKHREFSKVKKRVATELHDNEKLSDTFLSIGESYQKLRNFSKARKWYMKSWNMYRTIGNLEGQALAKVNIGNVLDSCGDWAGSLQAYEEGYRQCLDVFPSKNSDTCITSYSGLLWKETYLMFNFLLLRICITVTWSDLIILKKQTRDTVSDYCSETDTEGGCTSDNMLDPEDDNGQVGNKYSEEPDDDVTLASLVHRSRSSSKIKACKMHSSSKKVVEQCDVAEDTRTVLSRSCTNHSVGRKRVRVVLSDDESEESPEIVQLKKTSTSPANSMSVSDHGAKSNRNQDALQPNDTRDAPCAAEESTCSFKSSSPIGHAFEGIELGTSSVRKGSASKSAASGSKFSAPGSNSRHESQNVVGFQSTDADHHFWAFRIGEHLVYLDVRAYVHESAFSIESLKVEVACVYYLQISDEKRVKGLLPVIGELKYCGKVLDDTAPMYHDDQLASEQKCVDVVIDDWVPKRLMKLYVDCCTKLSEAPNKKLLTKLYNLEVSEDEVIVSDCGLQDLSITPFLDALRSHKTIAVLDLSHNLLGNQTIERLQHIFTSSSQTYGGLTLDLHCNRFGPTALFQICECAVMTDRLEGLNLSGNRLTDACSSYLFTILQKCKALYSLNVEQCSITSRTVQKMADALHEGSVLSHLSLGKNNPISGNAMLNLLSKLASLTRFTELSLTGIKLNKLMVDKLCLLAQSSCLSGLLLGGTSIGPVGTIRLTDALSCTSQDLLRLELSNCGLTAPDFAQICTNLSRINILDLNLGGNSFNLEGCDAIQAMLVNPLCSIRSLTLDRCNLGLAGIVCIIQALSGNDQLEELHLAENTNLALKRIIHYEGMQEVSTTNQQKQCNNPETSNIIARGNLDFENMQVADSEDEAESENHRALSGPHKSCASSSQKNYYSSCQVIQELVEALVSAKQLKVLDLSRNGLSDEAIQSLYSAWASVPRGDGMARKHVNKDVVHFSVDGMRCCGMKPCCRRDLQM
ncbi:protein TONSOKU isoform X2 [Panicum miliaceum]|uniref:Protein TONSOKU isoform X2 n=1 Tax=Panicum miliaceum TaxID=4540 RepID=A0A3L6RUN4_PANMI|nr:protein TONSOKU isoform X2 [Panicum miliaceum]